MTLREVQEEVKSWPPEQQDELAAYLPVLRRQRSPEHAEELGRRLLDRNPENWMLLDDVKAKLKERRSAKG